MRSSITIISLVAAGIAFSTIAEEVTPDKAAVKETVIPASLQTARIDIDGIKDKITLKPVKGMMTAAWMKQQNLDNNYLHSNSKVLNGEVWEDMEVSFIPDKDGVVILYLMGAYYKPKDEKTNIPIWVQFDEVMITGAELKNGGFETVDNNGKVANWSLNGELIKGKAQTGDNSVKVWTNKRASQAVNVTKDQLVTIKAKVKKAE
jgi:hypothetical protein